MHRLRKFRRSESGQVGVIFALAALPLAALTSAAIDYSQFTKEQNAISSGLDAAVLAAANNNAIADSDKDEYAKAHFLANYRGSMDLTLSPSVTSDRVRMTAEGDLKLTFGNIVGVDDLHLVEASAASLKEENTICVLSLSEDKDSAISFDDDLAFTASNCSVHSNSKSASAISSMTFGAKPTATSFCAVGGVAGEVEPHSKGECSPIADPYEFVLPAEIGVCKSEFMVEGYELGSNPDDTPVSRNVADGPTFNTMVDYTDTVILPAVNPVSAEDLLAQLQEQNFADDGYTGTNGDNSPNFERDVEALQDLSGSDFQDLLEYYDRTLSGPDILKCRDFPAQHLCNRANNPYVGRNGYKAQAHELAKAVFDLSYGSFYEQADNVPDIVTNGIAELINGQLYSRNNADNELIPISANLTGESIVLTPGTYCGGLTVDGISVRFEPGDYIFKDGPLTFLNMSQAKADQVTFGFTGTGATLNIESGSSLKIRAATTGPRKGLAFMQMIDPNLPGNREPISGVNRISSGGSVSMAGTAYFPEQKLLISGEDTHLGSSSPAVGLIADTVAFRGDKGSRVEIGVDHVKAGIPAIQPRADDGVRLIE